MEVKACNSLEFNGQVEFVFEFSDLKCAHTIAISFEFK